MALWIPILTTLIVFSAAVAIVAIALFVHYRKEVLRNKERMAAIEKGIALPDLTRADTKAAVREHGDGSLRTALILLFTGIGLTLALYVNSGEDGAVWGAFVGFIGLGYLVYWLIAGRKLKMTGDGAED
jgi:Flp pilus assembly protein TadB